MTYRRPPAIDHDHLDDLIAAEVNLDLPLDIRLPDHLSGQQITAAAFKALHAKLAAKRATALQLYEVHKALRPHWALLLNPLRVSQNFKLLDTVNDTLEALALATEIHRPDEPER